MQFCYKLELIQQILKNQGLKLKNKIVYQINHTGFLFATIIIEEKAQKDPWYITYWPVILTVTVVCIVVCIYYFSPEGLPEQPTPLNMEYENRLFTKFSGVPDLGKLFKWNLTETQILEELNIPREDFIRFLAKLCRKDPHRFLELQEKIVFDENIKNMILEYYLQ